MERYRLGIDGQSTRSPGGRTRDPVRDDDLRRAALSLLAEVGYDRLTIESVANHAQAGKATLYRRWAGKAELVMDAIGTLKPPYEDPQSGNLADDLHAIADSLDVPAGPLFTRVMAGLVTALSHDAAIRKAFEEVFVLPGRALLTTVFARAVASGEISASHDVDLLVELFPALLFQRLLTTGSVPDAAFATKVIDEVILPLVSGRAAA